MRKVPREGSGRFMQTGREEGPPEISKNVKKYILPSEPDVLTFVEGTKIEKKFLEENPNAQEMSDENPMVEKAV